LSHFQAENWIPFFLKMLQPVEWRSFMSPSDIIIAEGPQPDAVDAVVALHRGYYARAWGFGHFFEAKVAGEFAVFLGRYDPAHDRLFLALNRGRIVGSLVIDGGEPTVATQGAHLRWFIVDETCHGHGIGKALMDSGMRFVGANFQRCYLTTFAGLDAARGLYQRMGFRLTAESEAENWGTRVTEQRFEWNK
jgi:ribosomal protein S18 acetylase RimI-like enzyme